MVETERAPWTCRWGEPRLLAPPPLWLGGWLSQWTCLAATLDYPVAGPPERCETCGLWEPRPDLKLDVADERGRLR